MPPIDVISAMVPVRRARIPGSTASDAWRAVLKIESIESSKSATVIDSMGPAVRMAAVWTSTSMGPRLAVTLVTSASTCCMSRRSHASACTEAPSVTSSAPTMSRSRCDRAQIATLQPRFASSTATARPRPRDPPQTSTVFPERRIRRGRRAAMLATWAVAKTTAAPLRSVESFITES